MAKAQPAKESLSCIATASLKRTARVTALAAALTWPPAPMYPQPPKWPDTSVTRLQALALIQSLNAEILGSRSATLSLEKWCRDHKLAAEPRIVARVIGVVYVAPASEQLERLEVTSAGEVKYRRVHLECGGHILSVADNWYVPARLNAEANRLLETTGTPFGTAVRSLKPYRRTLSVKLLWLPLPEGWEVGATAAKPASEAGSLAIPDALFEHQAILYTRDHKPFSEVHEVYQRQILAFPPPRL
ncbi:MAG: hypothetical protein EXQ52_03320 [Bryobacterales bacterium]|nr:hypothetical protein [Bryobacterales bacterium]